MSRNQQGSPIIASIVLVIIGLVVAGLGFYSAAVQKDIKDHGVATTALITDKDERIEHHVDYEGSGSSRHRTERTEYHYFYVLDFNDKAGNKQAIKRDLAKEIWKTHEKGQSVDIKYLEKDPQKLRLAQELEGDPNKDLYIFGGIGVFLILAGAGIFGWCYFTGRIS